MFTTTHQSTNKYKKALITEIYKYTITLSEDGNQIQNGSGNNGELGLQDNRIPNIVWSRR